MKPCEINVLVGQADGIYLEFVNRIFAPRGINSLVVSDPAGVLDAIGRQVVHIAILDTGLGRIGGLGIVRIIRRRHPFLPCILMSDSASQDMLAEALELDVFSVISKPVDLKVLLDRLNRLFAVRYNSNIFEEIDSL